MSIKRRSRDPRNLTLFLLRVAILRKRLYFLTSELSTAMFSVAVTVFVAAVLPALIEGHGRLMEPPARASLWRFGFDAPINYEDNELFCGGFVRQYSQNGGKCGICGDAYDAPDPKENEAGGKYGLGIISRSYKVNEVITAKVDLTANHLGYFEFKLCPNNNVERDPGQECLDQHPLQLVDGSGTRFKVLANMGGASLVNIQLRLPQDVTCSQCVFQWHYNTGNSWGECDDHQGAIGCGDQEVFRGCADIEITA